MTAYAILVVVLLVALLAYKAFRDVIAEDRRRHDVAQEKERLKCERDEAKAIQPMTDAEVRAALKVVEQMRVVVNAIAFNSGLVGIAMPLPPGAEEAIPKAKVA
jgi:FAD/FMN-containing dehydrogenase